MRQLLILAFVLAIPPALLSLGCSDSKKAKGGSEEIYEDYGKPGSPNGESCYTGAAKGSHTCTDVLSGDTNGLRTLNLYCRKVIGQRARGACKREDLIGTCRYMKDAPTLRMRFYNQSWDQARTVCDQEAGVLDRFW